MKRIILILCLYLITVSVVSQKKLIDERNGFKTIKLGSKKSTFKNLTLFQNLEEMTAYNYYPIERSLYNVFDNNYDAIILYFDKNDSLIMIMITKIFTGNNFYQNALNYSNITREKFTRVFGYHDKVNADDKSGNISVDWYGKKAFFSVGTIYFGIAKGKAESNVIIGKVRNLSSGF